MAAHRKPTAELKLHGVYQRSRHGDRSLEPQPKGVPRKPAGMSKDASDHWKAVVPSLIDTGVATEQDAPALAAMCEFRGEYERAKRRKQHDRTRLLMMVAAHKEWINLASRFGLTPSDRARITGNAKEKRDKASQHLA